VHGIVTVRRELLHLMLWVLAFPVWPRVLTDSDFAAL
jgi:hypothetical protein